MVPPLTTNSEFVEGGTAMGLVKTARSMKVTAPLLGFLLFTADYR